MVNMDTDSSYMALTGDFISCVKTQHKRTFLADYGKWFVEPFCPDHKPDFIAHHLSTSPCPWIQQQCCKNHQLWDSRTPGKFKLEFTGQSILALNAKTYLCSKNDDELARVLPYPTDADKDIRNKIDKKRASLKSKVSSKGLSKRTNKLTDAQFKHVLMTKSSVHGTNTGFVRKNNKTYTYSQRRRGLRYFYGKRLVDDDGVSTSHLMI